MITKLHVVAMILGLSLVAFGLSEAPAGPDELAVVTSSGETLPLTFAAAPPTAAVDAAPAAPSSTETPAPPAQPAREPTTGEALSGLVAALRGGEWLLAAGGILWLLVHLLRWRRLAGWFPWLRSRVGGYVLAFGLSFAVAIATAITAGQGISLGLVLGAVAAGFAAIGMHDTARDVAGTK